MSIEILAYEETELGTLCLRRRELLSQPGKMVTEVTLNHEFLMSSFLTDSEKALSTVGLELVKDIGHPLSVLVGGLGLGYTAAELLKSDKIGTVETVEYLPQVISWLQDGLIPLADQLNAEEKLTVSQGDVYARLCEPVRKNDKFDLVVIDVDHSPEDVLGEQSKHFYSVDGLKLARQHLNPSGVIGIWSYDESSPLLTNMEEVFTDVRVESVTAWNQLANVEQTDWLFFGRSPGLVSRMADE
jgi:spermidine synthase